MEVKSKLRPGENGTRALLKQPGGQEGGYPVETLLYGALSVKDTSLRRIGNHMKVVTASARMINQRKG